MSATLPMSIASALSYLKYSAGSYVLPNVMKSLRMYGMLLYQHIPLTLISPSLCDDEVALSSYTDWKYPAPVGQDLTLTSPPRSASNTDLFPMAACMPTRRNLFPRGRTSLIISLNRENGGLVTTTSHPFIMSTHSALLKSPFPDRSLSVFAGSFATSSIPAPGSTCLTTSMAGVPDGRPPTPSSHSHRGESLPTAVAVAEEHVAVRLRSPNSSNLSTRHLTKLAFLQSSHGQYTVAPPSHPAQRDSSEQTSWYLV